MSTTVTIDGYKLEPAPLVTINKTYNKRGDGLAISANYTITLNFTIVADMGSPRSGIDATLSDTGWSDPGAPGFWTLSGYAPRETITGAQRLAAIERKQETIKTAFRNMAGEGHYLEIQSESGHAPIRAWVSTEDITFSEGIWFNTCQCTIVLKSSRLSMAGLTTDVDNFDDFVYMVESFSETWQLETDEATPESETRPRTYRMTHAIEAKGQQTYTDDTYRPAILRQPWEEARHFVYSQIANANVFFGAPGFDSDYLNSSGLQDLPDYYIATNHVRTENIDKAGGVYGVSETWVLASGSALEEFTIQKQNNIDNPLVSVSLNGTITGLERRNATTMALSSSKYSNALTKLTDTTGVFHSRAQTYAGVSLHVLPNSQSISKNPVTGVISYDYSYDNRPSGTITGATSEKVTVTNIGQNDTVAIIPILGGGTAGPVLQYLGSQGERKRTLSINAIMSPQDGYSFTYPDVTAIISAAQPTGAQVYTLDGPEESIDNYGNYNYSRTWVWKP